MTSGVTASLLVALTGGRERGKVCALIFEWEGTVTLLILLSSYS